MAGPLAAQTVLQVNGIAGFGVRVKHLRVGATVNFKITGQRFAGMRGLRRILCSCSKLTGGQRARGWTVLRSDCPLDQPALSACSIYLAQSPLEVLGKGIEVHSEQGFGSTWLY